MLKIKNLSVNYGGIKAVQGISMDIPDNQVITLIGANGAGKSSTLRAIMSQVHVAEGSILFNEEDITHVTADLKLTMRADR